MSESKLIKLLNNDPSFFYYNGNNSGGVGNFSQKNIKFGHDRRGSGDSGQPYITTPIPLRLSQSIGDDSFVRGGITTADRASQIDTERINRFLKDKPRGPLFIQRQVKLQFTNPKLEVRKFTGGGSGIFGAVSTLIAGAVNAISELVPGPTRLYNNGLNTIAQIGVNAFGQHFERHGLSPIQDDNSKYLYIVRNNNENGNNRLVGLKNKLIRPNISDPKSNNIVLGTINAILGAVNVFNAAIGRGTNPLLPTSQLIQPQDLIIDNYLGGPGSTYGRGRTLIRRFDVTSNGFNITPAQERIAPGVPSINYNNTTGVSDQWSDSANEASPLVRRGLTELEPNRPTNAPSYVDQTAIIYKSSPTARSYQAVRDISNNFETKQKYDVQGSLRVGKTNSNPNFSAYFNGKKTLDLANRYDPNILSVVFRIINPFTQVPDPIILSAYIKGFRDNFDASWNEYNYAGRSESFFTYGKFKRNVNFSLDIPCFNKEQLLAKYRALGQLASTTAGAYNENGLLGGVLIKLNVGNHIRGEYAILNNLSYEIPDETSWDIDAQLAMLIRATFSFTIIHSNLPEYKQDEGFYNHVDAGVAIFPNKNNQINTQKSTDDLIKYFSKEQKVPTALPTQLQTIVIPPAPTI